MTATNGPRTRPAFAGPNLTSRLTPTRMPITAASVNNRCLRPVPRRTCTPQGNPPSALGLFDLGRAGAGHDGLRGRRPVAVRHHCRVRDGDVRAVVAEVRLV